MCWGLVKRGTNYSSLEKQLGLNKDSIGVYRFIDSSRKTYIGSTINNTCYERIKQHIASVESIKFGD